MAKIKLPIMDRLIKAGYFPVHGRRHVKWTRGYRDNVWFAKQVIQANSNNQGSAIIRLIAGEPNGNAPKDQQGIKDVWYTDGYRGQECYSDLINLLKASVIRLVGLCKHKKSHGR